MLALISFAFLVLVTGVGVARLSTDQAATAIPATTIPANTTIAATTIPATTIPAETAGPTQPAAGDAEPSGSAADAGVAAVESPTPPDPYARYPSWTQLGYGLFIGLAAFGVGVVLPRLGTFKAPQFELTLVANAEEAPGGDAAVFAAYPVLLPEAMSVLAGSGMYRGPTAPVGRT